MNRSDGEAGILHHLAQRKPEIAQQVVEPLHAVLQIEALLCRAHIAELDLCFAPRLILAQALLLEIVRFEFKMRLDLLGKIIRAPPVFEHGYTFSLSPTLLPRINPMARVRRCHSLVFATSCARPFAVSE